MSEFGGPSFEIRPEHEPRPPDIPPHRPVEDLGRFALEHSVDRAIEPTPPEQNPRMAPELGHAALSASVDRATERAPGPETATLGSKVDDPMMPSGAVDAGDETAVRRARDEAARRIDTIERDFGFEIGGEPRQRLSDWHPQGANDFGFTGTCGIASVQELGRQMGRETSENQLTHTAVDHGLCVTNAPDPADNGAITMAGQQKLLSSLGLDSQVLNGQKAEDLAKLVEDGHGVLAYVNGQYVVEGSDLEHIAAMAGFEPQRGTSVNHSLHVTGTVRAPETGDLIGVIANDPTDKPGQTVDIAVLTHGWEEPGGQLLVVRRQ